MSDEPYYFCESIEEAERLFGFDDYYICDESADGTVTVAPLDMNAWAEEEAVRLRKEHEKKMKAGPLKSISAQTYTLDEVVDFIKTACYRLGLASSYRTKTEDEIEEGQCELRGMLRMLDVVVDELKMNNGKHEREMDTLYEKLDDELDEFLDKSIIESFDDLHK